MTCDVISSERVCVGMVPRLRDSVGPSICIRSEVEVSRLLVVRGLGIRMKIVNINMEATEDIQNGMSGGLMLDVKNYVGELRLKNGSGFSRNWMLEH